MLLNTHSTAVFSKLGKVVGNTMTNVSPSNLKLIGRASYLIYTHVNQNTTCNISYELCNLILYHVIEKKKKPEVAISIIFILENLKKKLTLTQ